MTGFYNSVFDKDDRMPPMIVIVDLGNANLKLIAYYSGEDGYIHRREVVIPHGFLQVSEGVWQTAVDSVDLSRGRSARSQIFKLKVGENWHIYHIGENATLDPNNSPIVGSYKYIKGGIDALLVAGLNELFEDDLPKGHNNIILGVGHPPTETRHIAEMLEIVKGPHKMETPKGRVKVWNVRAAIPFDENIGGLLYMVSRVDEGGRLRDEQGRFIANPMKPGDRFLMGDWGGRLGSLGWIKYQGGVLFTPEYNSFVPIEGGIVTVREAIRSSLIKSLKQLKGSGHAELPDELIDDVLKTRQLLLGGDNEAPIDVNDIVQSSLTYLQTIRSVAQQRGIGAGSTAKRIVMTGGTLLLLGEEIKKQFENKSFLPVAPYNEIVKANCRGGAIIVMSKLKEMGNLPLAFQKSMGEFIHDGA